MITMQPIAIVRSPRTDLGDDRWGGVLARIELADDLPSECLDGLEAFSHVEVFFYFDRVAQAGEVRGSRHPRNNPAWPRVGIFAQRSKGRPNRLGSTFARLVARTERALEVEGLDAIDGTPVLDIKPVMREFLPRGPVWQPRWSHELLRNYWAGPSAARAPRTKTLGIVGGIAPESTIEYYRTLVSSYRQKVQDGSYPPIVINSIDMTRMLALVAAEDRAGLTAYLLAEVEKLVQAGADVCLLASNTPHVVFADLQRQAPVPMLSIVEAACEAVKALGVERAGLFGTRYTMQGRFYSEVFSREGIALVVPSADEQRYIHDAYMGELVKGIFLDGTRERLLAIVDRMLREDGIQALVLGGTELPLILRDDAGRGIPFVDTTRVHVERAVAEMLG